MRVRFGEFVLDADRRQLESGGGAVHLTPKAFQLLEALLNSRPRAVSKQELQDQLWPKTFVTEGTLTSLLTELRTALADDAKAPRYVRTVHRFGYAFCGDATELRDAAAPDASPAPVWRLVWGSRDLALPIGLTILGRDPAGYVFIDHATVSRHHARITVSADGATLEDLASKNGTFLGGKRLSAAEKLADADEIRLGSVTLTIRLVPQQKSTETAV